MNQIHHLLFFSWSCYYLLLAWIIIEHKIDRTCLYLVIRCWSLPLLLIGIVIVFNHKIEIAIYVVNQFITIIQVQTNKYQTLLVCYHLSPRTYHIHLLLRIVHLYHQFKSILQRVSNLKKLLHKVEWLNRWGTIE